MPFPILEYSKRKTGSKMSEYKNTFVEFVKGEYKDISVCPWVYIQHYGFCGKEIRFNCSIVNAILIFSDKYGEDPCSIDDFKNCPLFPFQNKEKK
jgi:hypothetical protein